MTTSNSSGYKTFQATAVAIGDAVRVKVDSNGLISAAGVADVSVGVTTEVVAVSGYGTVKLWSAPGTFLVKASAAVARGAQLYATASGKVDDATASGLFTGLQAVEAATADGDIIEAVRTEQIYFIAAAEQAAAPAGGTGATAGAYDTAGHRDAMIALVNAMRDVLIANGFMKGAA